MSPRRGDQQQSGEWEKPLFQQRGWVISAGFLLAVVVFAGLAAVGVGDGDSSESPESKPSPHSSDPQAPGDGSDGGRPAGCRTDDHDQEKPTEPPQDMRWKNVGADVIPTSASAGPTKYDGPVWSCFAHTPMGAVMAVHTITQHISHSGWRDVAKEQMVPGKGRDVFMRKRAREKSKTSGSAPNSTRYAGFQVLGYSKKQASVMVLMELAKKAYYTIPIEVRWQDGDWKLVQRKDGSYSPNPSLVDSARGYVTWGS